MDLAALYTALSLKPELINERSVIMRGAWAPVILPLDGLDPKTRAQFVLQASSLPLEQRVETALAAEETAIAWDLVIRHAGPAHRTLRLNVVLSQWAAQELARLKLPASHDAFVVLAADDQQKRDLELATVLGIVRDTLSSLSWPRWYGPALVLIGDLQDRDPYLGQQVTLRPALPVIRLPDAKLKKSNAQVLAAELGRIALDLNAPPEKGWPAWINVGVGEVLKARVRGEGPSPLGMLAMRKKAGAIQLREVISDKEPNPALCQALVAPLLHSRRRHLFDKMLALIRGGASSEGALSIAYGLTIEQLLIER